MSTAGTGGSSQDGKPRSNPKHREGKITGNHGRYRVMHLIAGMTIIPDPAYDRHDGPTEPYRVDGVLFSEAGHASIRTGNTFIQLPTNSIVKAEPA